MPLSPRPEGRLILPFDIVELLEAELARNQRPPDGKLHASSHLDGSLRHTQLAIAGAPQLPEDTASQINLAVGTAIHSILERATRGKLVINECKLDEFLPEGWSGTADAICWNPERRCFVLVDYKSQKAGSLHYIHKGGAKSTHIAQVSAYYHALVDAGLPMLNGCVVLYIPKSQLTAAEGKPVYPTAQEITPLPREELHAQMSRIRADVDRYLASLPGDDNGRLQLPLVAYLTDALAPVQDRVLVTAINKQLKRPVIDVKLAPSWSAAYCPFPDELCNCRHQTTNKIGSWDRDDAGRLVYTPLAKAPQPPGIPTPEAAQVAALVRAQKEKEDASS